MGQLKFIASLIFISLFAVAIVSYSIGFGNDNYASVSLSNDSDFVSFSATTDTTVGTTFKDDVNSSSVLFNELKIEEGGDTARSGDSFGGGVGTLLKTMTSLFGLAKTNIFVGSFGIVFTALSSYLVYVGLVYWWKTWKGGNPD